MVSDQLIASSVACSRTIIGIAVRPYETYRRIVARGSGWELLYLGALLAAYFAVASVVKTAAFRPFLLTRQFVVLGLATIVAYVIAVAVLWQASRFFGGRGELRALAIAWAYTLIPTLIWFLSTSLLYVVIPPPRTTSPQGIAFSILYLAYSAMLFFWKAILAYLTLRFSMKLDLGRIVAVFTIAAPLLGLYSVWMYRLGIFKIPFI